jgi:predicted DCC family thiol-disulfide oxidoreductase YuxK
MNSLTIFYDPACGLCCGFRQWLEKQGLWVAIEFIGYQTLEAEVRFPGIRSIKADKECVVLADDGRWWQGADAWIVCLWATREYRLWSSRLASPVFRPLIGNVVHLVSSNRLKLSRIMCLKSDAALAEELRGNHPVCEEGNCTMLPHLEEAKDNAWK